MFQPQIAVAFANAPLADAGGEAITLGREGAQLKPAHVIERRAIEEIADERRRLREVLVDVLPQDLHPAERRRRPGSAEKDGQPLCDGGEALRTEHSAAEHGRPRSRAPAAAACAPPSR